MHRYATGSSVLTGLHRSRLNDPSSTPLGMSELTRPHCPVQFPTFRTTAHNRSRRYGVLQGVDETIQGLPWTAVAPPPLMTRSTSDPRSFVEGVNTHLDSMLRLARRLAGQNAEDIVQDALVRAWVKREQYDPTRGSFGSWLLAITADRAYKTWRWNTRRRGVWSRLVDVAEPDEFIDLERALEKLPARQRLAVDCFYFAGLSVAETASVMKCSEGTVKSTLAAARGNLRGLLR